MGGSVQGRRGRGGGTTPTSGGGAADSFMGKGSGPGRSGAVLQEVPVQVERVEEGLGEEAKGAEHAGEEAVFGARLPRPVHCHFNSLVVGGALQRFGLDGDGDGERFAAS